MSGLTSSLARRAADLGRGLDPSLALLAGIAFVTQVGVAVMLPLLPLYATALGAEPLVLGLLTSSFAVTNTAGQLVAGFAAQRVGPRRLVPAGMGLYAGANALIATAGSALPLIVWRSIAGLGGGLALVSERLYLVGVVDRARLAFANGLLSAAGSAGTVTGPAVGGLIAAASDLRGPFLLVAATSAVAAAGALFLPRQGDRPIGDAEPAAARSPADAAAEAAANRRTLVVLLLANLGLMAGFGVFVTTYAPFATEVLGWSTVEVGLQFSLFGLGSIFVGPWLAHRADRHGRRRTAILALVPVGVFAVALVGAVPGLILAATAVLAGGGIAGFGAIWYALLGEATGGARRGGAFGTVSALSNLGIVVGAMAASVLWELVDVRAGVGLLVFTVLGAAAATLALPPDRPVPPAPADPAAAAAA